MAPFKVGKKLLRVPQLGPRTLVAMASVSRHGSNNGQLPPLRCLKEFPQAAAQGGASGNL